MSDALEKAAIAFDTEIGGNKAPATRGGDDSDASTLRSEPLFSRLGDLDADSGEAGGDDTPLRVAKPAKEVADPLEELDEEELDPNEADEEVDEEAEAAAKKAAEEEDDDQPVYEVLVDGERKEVPLKEALEGYIRTETFHKRLNWLNGVKQEVQQEAAKVVEQRDKYSQQLASLQKQLDLLVPAEPNWAEEYQRDPQAAAALQKQFETFKKERAAISAEEARVAKEKADEEAQWTIEYARQENAKILANNPTWKDPAVQTRDINLMAETARAAGFSDEEIINTKDSRMVMILLKAAKFDALTKNKPQPIRVGKKPVNPGAGSVRTAPKGLDKAHQQLRRSGSVEDAANVFTSIIKGK